MGNRCPNDVPCIELKPFNPEMVDQFFTSYKEVEPGFYYDLDANDTYRYRVIENGTNG